jgi:hypothetical protein
MNSKDYAKLVQTLKEHFATHPSIAGGLDKWLGEKDRLLVDEMARAKGGLDLHIMEFHSGRAAQRQEIRQTFFPKEVQDE